MLNFLEKYKSIFHIFCFIPLAHMGVMLLAGEVYRRSYPIETFVLVNQSPGVVFVNLLTSIAGFTTFVVLAFHAYKNESFDRMLRVFWVGNLILFGVFAMPVYFYRFVLNPVLPLNKQEEMTKTLKYSGMFLMVAAIIFYYQSKIIHPYIGKINRHFRLE